MQSEESENTATCFADSSLRPELTPINLPYSLSLSI